MAAEATTVNGPSKTATKYDYGGVKIMLENCILPKERLFQTPSMRDGLDKEIEIDLRIVGCEYIQVAGILLKLPQVLVIPISCYFCRLCHFSSSCFVLETLRLQWLRHKFYFSAFTILNPS